jgi:uncharacterized protein YijF (DUF1287 family)
MNQRLEQLGAPWVDIQNDPTSSPSALTNAAQALDLIEQIEAQINNNVFYDMSYYFEPS